MTDCPKHHGCLPEPCGDCPDDRLLRVPVSRPHLWKPVRERIEARIDIHPITDCWNWTAGLLRVKGGPYGRLHVNGANTLAHRASYEEYIGAIPEGFFIDHLCRNSRCVNPEHLEAVTPGENNRRANGFSGRNWRKTHCPHGHEYSPENTFYIERDGGRKPWRVCKTCHPRYKKETVAA